MWEVARELAAHAPITDSSEAANVSGGDSGSEKGSSFKQQIEIPLAVSARSNVDALVEEGLHPCVRWVHRDRWACCLAVTFTVVYYS